MLQGGENITTGLRTNNQNLLTVDANRNAYVNNVLIPMVNALKGNPGVYSYEIFNEPEGMTTQHGWTTANGGTEVDQMYIQKTVNVFAAAIHTTDPNARVTSGAQTFDTCSNASGNTNLYSNARSPPPAARRTARSITTRSTTTPRTGRTSPASPTRPRTGSSTRTW